MKLKVIIIVLAVLIAGIGSIRVVQYYIKDEGAGVVVVPVKVAEINEKCIEDVLVYQGTISPVSVENISFKSSARLGIFNGEVGDELQSGQVLAELELAELSLAYEASDKQFSVAEAEYNRALTGARPEDIALASISADKASAAVKYLEAQALDIKTLFDGGFISQSELEGMELELSLAKSDLALAIKTLEKANNGSQVEIVEAAKAGMSLASINKELQQSLLDDASYVLDAPRIIVDQLYEIGELVPAGYPVAIVRSLEQSVVIGVSRKDLDIISTGQKVKINFSGKSYEGEVVRVAQIPDVATFLYEVEINLPSSEFIVGEIVICELLLGEKNVVTIPVTTIMNDGIDYVYLAVEGIAKIKKVEIIDVVDGNAIVEGLNVGDQMIISNLNRIHEQSNITVEE